MPLSTMKFCKADVDALLAKIPPRAVPDGIIVPSVVAGSLLGIPGHVVAMMIKAGLLRGEFKKRVGHIQLSDLAEFSGQYILGREGDLLVGKGGFSRQMEHLGFAPAGEFNRYRVWLRAQAGAILG